MTSLAVALLLLSNPTSTQAQSADLRMKCKVGAQTSYRIQSKVSAVGADGMFSWTTDVTEKLTKISGSEFHWQMKYKISNTKSDGVMAGADAQLKMLDGTEMTRIVNSRGEMLRAISNGKEIKRKGSSAVTYPGRVTKVGETWKSNLEVSNMPVPITYRFVGTKKSKGLTLAQIVGSFTKDSVAKALKPPTFFVDVATGLTVSSSADIEVRVREYTLRVEYTVERT